MIISLIKNLLVSKNIDPINKHYFTENRPDTWFALGMLVCFLSASGMFDSMVDIGGFLIFLACLFGTLWFGYNFFIVLFCNKSPSDSPGHLRWLKKREKNRELFLKWYEILLAPIVRPVIKLIGYLILGGLIVGGCAFLSSLSVKTLLIIVILLILFK